MPSYIIFHPDRQRQRVDVIAEVLTNASSVSEVWTGEVLIDSLCGGCSNEDPWCLSHPWLYSFCHATQLKRSKMGPGNIVFFVSGDAANDDELRCDTVFVIEKKLEWESGDLPAELAKKYLAGTPEYERHFKYGLPQNNEHTGQYTFTGKKPSSGVGRFSFLPLSKSGINVKLSVDRLGKKLTQKIQLQRWGKYPVVLTQNEAGSIYKKISDRSKIRIVTIKDVLNKPRDRG